MGIHARSLVNSFHITFRTPAEIFGIISSHLTEDDLFSASQVCRHWRSILTSSAYLWAWISYNCGPRTIASLERCGPLPIQLRLEKPLPSEVLEKILLHGNKIASLNVNHDAYDITQLPRLFAFSRPSVERLILYTDYFRSRRPEYHAMRDVWQDFPLLRKLFVAVHSISVDRLTAPNLLHLVLEGTGCQQNVTAQTILDMLRRFPLLETLLLNYEEEFRDYDNPVHGDSVRLPHLRRIEVGPWEVHSGLITHLDLPPDVVAGFQSMHPRDVKGRVPDVILDSMRHVLRRVKIRSITLAAYRSKEFLIRFEGLRGSLEITVSGMFVTRTDLADILGARGVVFSHSSHIEDVTEMHIVNCAFETYQGLEHVKTAMPNVETISFFRCMGAHPFALLASENTSSSPFPRLERVMVLGCEPGLEEMVRNRRDLGVPLKTLVLGRNPGGFNYDCLEDDATLEGLVDNLQVRCPVEIVEWGVGNEIVDVWSAAGAPSVVSFKRAQ